MNKQTEEALKMAIEYLEAQGFSIERQAVLDACKEALEQPAWQGLTDDEIGKLYDETWKKYKHDDIKFARGIEQALKDKNHG